MVKLNPKICYLITLILFLFGYLFQWLFFSKEYVSISLFTAVLFGVLSTVYIMYIFVPIRKTQAYLRAFISTVIIDIGFFASFLPSWYYEIRYSHEAASDEAINLCIFSTFPVILIAFIFSLVYGIVYYIQKRKV